MYHSVVLLPRSRLNDHGLGFSPFARHYLGNHYCSLLLSLLRCFSSAGSPTPKGVLGVAPFGNPRINAPLQLPVAYRSFTRPSSPPYAKASTVCPYYLSSQCRHPIPVCTAPLPSDTFTRTHPRDQGRLEPYYSLHDPYGRIVMTGTDLTSVHTRCTKRS